MEYAAMLLMKPGRAKVGRQGIKRFNTLYTAPELGLYVDEWVNIRWDAGNVTRLYVYAESGKKICEAYSAELLEFGDRVSQEALAELHTWKKHNKKMVRQFLEERRTPPELREALDSAETAVVVGTLDLTIGHKPDSKVIALPIDKEYHGEVAARSRKKRSGAGGEFLAAKGESVLDRLRAMNE